MTEDTQRPPGQNPAGTVTEASPEAGGRGARTDGHRGIQVPTWAVLAVCCIAQFMVVLDVSIVNVALPQMRHDLGLSVNGQQWVLNAYTLTFAGFLMLGGRAADIFGRRRVFMSGLFFFTLCSLVGGLAQNGAWLITARAAQGVGGAVLAPATLSLLLSKYTAPKERSRALGAWSATAASGASIGVLAGGVLTDLLNWRWVLFVNVPIGVVLLAASWASLSESKAEGPRISLDVPGALTVTGGLAILTYGIVSTDAYPWGSGRTIGTLAVGAAVLAAFFVIEGKIAKNPLVPLGIFKRRTISAANGVAVTVGTALFGMYFFLSLYLQQVAGFSPLRAGLAFFPGGLFTLIGARIGVKAVMKLGPQRQLIAGTLLAAVAMFWIYTLPEGGEYWVHIFGPLVLFGVGLGISFVPMTLAATAGVPVHQSGLASALINTTRQVGGAVGLAVMATIAATVADHRIKLGVNTGQALTSGYDRAFLVAAFVLIVGAVLSSLLPSKVQATHGAPATPQAATKPSSQVSAEADEAAVNAALADPDVILET